MKNIYALICAIFLITALQAQTSWKGTTSTSWSNSANWTAGIPNSGVDAIIGDANFTGSFQPSLTSGTGYCRSLTIGNGSVSSTLSVARNLNCYGDLIIGANGSVLQNSNNRIITVRGNWTNNGTYSATATGTGVTFSGTPITISGTTTFRAITINYGANVTLAANIAVTTSVSISGTLDPSTFTVSGAGSIAVNSTGILMVKAATFAGNYASTGGFTFSGTSTVNYASSTLNQTISAAHAYGYLRISGGTTKSLTADLPALISGTNTSGRIYVDAGTFDLQSYTCNRGTSVAGGYFILASGTTLKIGGTNSFPANFASVSIATSSTVYYCGTNQTITDYDYGHLIFQSASGSVTKTMPASTLVVTGDFTSAIGSGTGVSYTASGALIVNGSVNIGASTTFNGSSFSHTFKSAFVNNGTFTGSTSTATFTGTNAVISGSGTTNFYNVTFTGSGISAAAATPLTVSGNLVTSGAATFTHSAGGTITMNGTTKIISGTGINFCNLIISGTITSSSSFVISGDLNISNSFIAAALSTVTMSGASKTLTNSGTCTFYSFLASGTISTASNFSMLASFTVASGGSFTATNNTATFNGSTVLSGNVNLYHVTINATKTLRLATNAVLGIEGTFTKTGTLNVTTSAPNTVSYNGSGAQSIVSATYNNLTLATGGTKTAAGNITVNRDITIDAGVTMAASSYTHTIYRHFTNNGTFTAGTSTVTLAGTEVAVISGTTTFYNLTENKTSSTISAELHNNITVNNLTITAGNMQTGIYSVTITGTRSGNGIIIGTITHSHAFAAATAYYFEGPNNSVSFVAPVGVNSVTVKVIPGPVANIDPWRESVNREYEVTVPGGTYSTATFRYHYEDNELNAFVEPTLALFKYNSGVQWDSTGFSSRNSTSNYVEYNGITNLPGRYTASGVRSIVRWNGSVSTAWENALNWTPVSGTNMSVRVPQPTDAAQIGQVAFTNQPTLSSNQQIGLIELGSAQAVNLNISSGTLDILGSAKGTWSTSRSHTVTVAGAISVGTYFLLSDGTNGHDITLNIGNGSVTILGDLKQDGTGAVTFSGNGTLTLAGHYNYISGSFTAGSGMVVYSGSEAQDVASVPYNNLTFNKSTSRATIASPVTVSGNLATLTGGELYADADVTVNGNITIGAGTTVIEDDVAFTTGGNWTTTGLFTANNGTVTFNGTGAQSVNANTFNTVIVNKSAGTLTLSGNLLINSNLTLAAGTLNLGSNQCDRSNTGGVLTLAAATTLQVGGANNFPQNFSANSLSATSTVEYNSASAQDIMDVVYGHLTLTNGNANGKSLLANTDVAGDFLINSSAVFIPGALTITVGGNFTNNGTFTPATSTLKLTGTSKSFTGPATVCNLVVTGSYIVASGATNISGDFAVLTGASFSFGSNNVSLDGDLTVNGSLTSNGTATFTGTRVQTLQIMNAIVSASTGVINFNGTVAPILNSNTSPSYATVNINNTAGISPSVPWTVYFACNIAPGASFNGGALTHTFYGNFTNNGTVTSSGELKFTPTPPFSAGATIQLDGTSFVSTGKVTFGGTSPITIVNANPVLNQVAVTNTNAAGVTAPSSWTVNGELFIAVNSTFHCGTGFTHNLQDNITNNGTLDGQTSTVNMNGTGATVNGLGTTSFYNLVIPAVADVTLNQNIGVSKDLVVDGIFTATGRTVIFNGTTAGTIDGAAGTLTLDDMEQNKTANTTTLLIPVTVTGDLIMTNGIISTTAVNLLTLTDNATATSGTSTSYVDGPMKKIGDDAFVFPVGDGNYWARLGISAPATSTDAYTAQYFAAAYSNTTNMAANPAPALNNVSTIEHWTCDRTTGSSSVTVTLYWENASRSVINNYTPDLVVAHWNGSAWENNGQSAINPGNPGDITSNSASSFGTFTFGSLSGSNPLPIELLHFTATLNDDNKVDLDWATAVEINNDFFEVERTTDGITYETVATVDGSGTSSQQHSYDAVDRFPKSGVSYYRLKQTDENGHSTYSELQMISYEPKMEGAISVYPNPGDGTALTVNVPALAGEKIAVTIYGADGKTAHVVNVVAGNDGVNSLRVEFPLTLQPGMYFVDVTSSDEKNTKSFGVEKIIVQ